MLNQWRVVLHDKSNQPILDISRFITINLSLTVNDIHTLSFDLDLYEFQKACRDIGAIPQNILYPQSREIKVYKNDDLVFGGIISQVTTNYQENGATIKVSADSYLQYFATRYISKVYHNTDRSQIAWDAIDTVQSEANGDLGIQKGTLATIYKSDLDNDLQDVKTVIQNYTKAEPTTYDFEITPDKIFNTYVRLGTNKPETVLTYPFNVISMTVPRDADALANRVIALGSGLGEERLETTKNNVPSQIKYRIKTKKKLFNSVKNMTTLNENAAGVLGNSYEVLVVPELTVDENTIDITKIKLGDSVRVKVENSDFDSDVDGLYRIYKQSIKVDENNHETIKLSFYNDGHGGDING